MEMLNGQYLVQFHVPLETNVKILIPMVGEICDAKIFCDLVLEVEGSTGMKVEEVAVVAEYVPPCVEPISSKKNDALIKEFLRGKTIYI